jgi:hypothetical protein
MEKDAIASSRPRKLENMVIALRQLVQGDNVFTVEAQHRSKRSPSHSVEDQRVSRAQQRHVDAAMNS